MQSRGARRRGTEKPLKRDDAWWKARAILEFMQKSVSQKLVPSKNLTLAGFARAMARSYDIEDAATAEIYIQAYADQIVVMLESKKHEAWTTRPIYNEL